VSLSPRTDGSDRCTGCVSLSVWFPGPGTSVWLSAWPAGRLPARSRSNLPFRAGSGSSRNASKQARERASERASVGASRTDQPVCVHRHDIRASDAVRDWDKLHVCLASSRDGSPFPSLTDRSAPKRDHRCSFVRSFVHISFLPSLLHHPSLSVSGRYRFSARTARDRVRARSATILRLGISATRPHRTSHI